MMLMLPHIHRPLLCICIQRSVSATRLIACSAALQKQRTKNSQKAIYHGTFVKFQRLLLKPIFPSELYRYPSIVKKKPTSKTSAIEITSLPSLSHENFLQMLKSLPTMNKKKLALIMDAVNDECTSRLQKNTIPLEDSVLMADIFVACQHYHGSYNKLLPQVLDVHFNEVSWSISDILHILLFMSMNRSDYRSLMGKMEKFLFPRLNEISGNQAAFVCNAFYLTQYSLQISTMKGIAERVYSDIQAGVLDMHALNGFLKALTTKRFLDVKFMDKFAESLLSDSILCRLDQQLCMRIITFWATKGISHPSLFKVLLSLHHPKDFVRRKELERLLTHCTQVQYQLPQEYIQEILETVEADRFYRNNPHRLTDILLSLLINDIYPRRMIEIALSPYFHKEMKQFLDPSTELHPVRGRLIFIDQIIRIRRPSISQFKLPKEVYEKFHSARGQSSIAYFNFRRRSALQPIYNFMKKLCGGVEYVKCDVVLPFSKCPDVEIHLDAANKPIPHNVTRNEPKKPEETIRMKMHILPDDLSPPVQNEHYMPTTPTSDRKILVRVTLWNQYVLNTGQLTGKDQCEINLLNQMGYEVLLINPADSLQFFKSQRRDQELYMKENILRPLNIDVL